MLRVYEKISDSYLPVPVIICIFAHLLNHIEKLGAVHMTLTKHFPLRRGRAHEVSGPAASGFAAMACGSAGGHSLWIVENRHHERISPVGLTPFCDPKLVLMAIVKSADELLATAEEALRAGAVTTVVAELNTPLSFTAGRRLQLAAEAGNTTGIFIIGAGMGNNAAETRWQCMPVFAPHGGGGDSTLQYWRLIKNKSGTLGEWRIRWDGNARCITVVPDAAN